MVMVKTSIAEVKAHLSEYLDRVQQGERILICRHNTPVAELRPVEATLTAPRPLGPMAGRPAFAVPQGFFEPLSDLEIERWEGAGGLLPATWMAPGEGQASRVAEAKPNYRGGPAPGTRTRRRRS